MLRDQHGDGSRSPPSSHNSPPSCQTTWSSSPVFYFLSSFSLPIILPSPFSEKTPISWWSVVFMYFLLIEFWLALLESIYLLNPLFIPDTFKKMEQARCCRHYLSHPPTQPFLPANPTRGTSVGLPFLWTCPLGVRSFIFLTAISTQSFGPCGASCWRQVWTALLWKTPSTHIQECGFSWEDFLFCSDPSVTST